jgi:hypothetical protein
MKSRITAILIMITAGVTILAAGYRCSGPKKIAEAGLVDTIYTNIDGKGVAIEVSFNRGKSHNHPLMAIWLEDKDGKYIETIFVAESIGKGIFQHGDKSKGQWQAGPVRRPAALPYWGHQRGTKAEDGYYIPAPDNPMPDAVTGPTPEGDFALYGRSTLTTPRQFKVMLEINQSWDWNSFWTNSKYPDDANYKTSSQPALVYEAFIDLDNPANEYIMAPIGHSHYSGLDGSLNKDLSTITTALEIVDSVIIKINPKI